MLSVKVDVPMGLVVVSSATLVLEEDVELEYVPVTKLLEVTLLEEDVDDFVKT